MVKGPSTAIFTVVYPAMEPFLAEFLASCSQQSDRDFDLVVANDSFPDFPKRLGGLTFTSSVFPAHGSPSEIRQEGIRELIQRGYENVIFADSDDRLASNRVAQVKKLLGSHDLVVNDLRLFGAGFDAPTSMLSPRFGTSSPVTAQDLRHSNCMGLTNSSAKVSCLKKLHTAIPAHIQAFDWAYFSLLLRTGVRAIFTGDTYSDYRQHGRNLASPLANSEAHIVFGVQVKRDHYAFMAQYDSSFSSLRDEYAKLARELESDLAIRQSYCAHVLSRVRGIPLWWEAMSLPASA